MTRWVFTGKQFAFSLTCGLLILGALASTANAAIQFQIGGSGNGFTTVGTGYGNDPDEKNGTLLGVAFAFEPSVNNQSFNLNAGQSFSFNFGTVTFSEPDAQSGITANETDNLDVTATLVFVAPPSGNTNSPATVAVITGSVSDNATDLTLSFDPTIVSFGDGGQFSVTFNTLSFNEQETLDLNATVTLLREPVPEPASLITWGALGVAGLALGRRRRIPRSSESQPS